MALLKEYWDLASLGVNLAALSLSGFQNHRAYGQAKELHDDAVEADIAMQFQVLSQELLVAAKEADRDVWEQQNERFNNLTILAVLVLSVTVSLVTEGSFDDEGEHASGRASWFVLFTALAMTSLFVCLTASYFATNNMSRFMSVRSGKLSKRIHDLLETGDEETKLSAQMSTLLHEKCRPTRDGLWNEIKRPHAQGKKVQKKPVSNDVHATLSPNQPGRGGEPSSAAAKTSAASAEYEGPLLPGALPPYVLRNDGAQKSVIDQLQAMRFAQFFSDHCQSLNVLAHGSFALGVVMTVCAMYFLVLNEFEHAKGAAAWTDPANVFMVVMGVCMVLCLAVWHKAKLPAAVEDDLKRFYCKGCS